MLAGLSTVLAACLGAGPATPRVVDAVTLVANHRHACALIRNGTVQCWGTNEFGQLGTASTADAGRELQPVVGVAGATAIAAGSDFSCAVITHGRVRCWGLDLSGQLGEPETDSASLAAVNDVPGLEPSTSVAAGEGHACSVTIHQTVQCWGANEFGQLGDGTRVDRLTPVMVLGVKDARMVTAGAGFTCVALVDGSVDCWGLNFLGQLGDGTRRDRSRARPVSGIHGVTAMATDLASTCAIAGTTVRCWGDNSDGQLGVDLGLTVTRPATVRGLRSPQLIAVGERSACVADADGVVCWGGPDDVRGRQRRMVRLSGEAGSGRSLKALGLLGLTPWAILRTGSLVTS